MLARRGRSIGFGLYAIAGLGCFVLAFGHMTVGLRWVLPNLTKGHLAGTPFGPPAMTLGMVRFTWHVVSVLLLGFGILLMALAWAPGADPKDVPRHDRAPRRPHRYPLRAALSSPCPLPR